MKWRKRGLIYAPSGNRWWARRYATLPTAHVVDARVLRVYFAALDDNQYGRIGYVDVAADDPQRILYETPEPVLNIGALGTFDDCGVNPSCVITIGGTTHLYYIGWQRAERVPYMLFIGLASSGDGGRTFRKHARVPLLDRTAEEPFSRSAPFVGRDDERFRMWYWSCQKWADEPGGVHYTNVIKTAESADGLAWRSRAEICIPLQGDDEYSVGRPWVVMDGVYRMWYSIRARSVPYRIGYAESHDGVQWVRKDEEAGIAVSESGWDSEMICYPCVVAAGGRTYMFYNGNRHGSTGFGYAVLEE